MYQFQGDMHVFLTVKIKEGLYDFKQMFLIKNLESHIGLLQRTQRDIPITYNCKLMPMVDYIKIMYDNGIEVEFEEIRVFL